MDDPPRGRMIAGRYEFLGEIGRGGMGVVLRAFDHRLQMEVALKVLKQGLAKDSGEKDSLVKEARVLARLTDPAIVRVYDLADTEVGLMLVLEFVQGPNFAQVLQARWRLTETELLHSMRQVCTGLAAAHNAGVIHRDLKPPNLLVSPGKPPLAPSDPTFLLHAQIKITDFGISKFVSSRATAPDGGVLGSTDATQSAAGTPFYMAPEQFRGDPCTPASDVYSLGIIAYQSLTGSPPFVGTDIQEIARQHFRAVPPVIEGCSPRINDAIQRALAKNPAERFATALQFLAALETPAAAVADPVVLETDILDRAAAWLRRHKWKLILGAFAVIAVPIAILVSRPQTPQVQPSPFQLDAHIQPDLGKQFELPADLDPLPAAQSLPQPSPAPPPQKATPIRKGRILWTAFIKTTSEVLPKIEGIGPEGNIYLRDSRANTLWALNDSGLRWGYRDVIWFSPFNFNDPGRLWIVSCGYANILSSCDGAVFNAEGAGGKTKRVLPGMDQPPVASTLEASRFEEDDAQNRHWPSPPLYRCTSRLGVVTLRAKSWQATLDSNCESAAIVGSNLMVSTTSGQIQSINTTSGGTDWTYTGGSKPDAFEALSPSDVIVLDGKHQFVYALRNGAVRWRFDSADWISEIRTGPGGTVYFRTDGAVSGIHALDADGKPLWSLPLGEHISAVAGLRLDPKGRIYLAFSGYNGRAGVLCIGDE
jgi:serine/threonine protein kinase